MGFVTAAARVTCGTRTHTHARTHASVPVTSLEPSRVHTHTTRALLDETKREKICCCLCVAQYCSTLTTDRCDFRVVLHLLLLRTAAAVLNCFVVRREDAIVCASLLGRK